MIFVTLGTQDKGFERLLKAIDRAIDDGTIKDKVVVQAGFTKYKSKNMEIFTEVSKEEFDKYLKEAKLVITHGGVGSILGALKYHKTVIAAPRLAKYKEHTNDHQKQIIDEFTKEGYIIPLKDFTKMDKVIKKAESFKPKEYQSGQEEFIKLISDYIEKEDHISWYNRDKKVILTALINLLVFSILGSFNLNIYLALTISYILSCLLLYLLKNKKLNSPLTVIMCFYLIEGLSLLLFSNLHINFILAKVIINFMVIIIYHFLDKRN